MVGDIHQYTPIGLDAFCNVEQKRNIASLANGSHCVSDLRSARYIESSNARIVDSNANFARILDSNSAALVRTLLGLPSDRP